jgi:hypothetical protein
MAALCVAIGCCSVRYDIAIRAIQLKRKYTAAADHLSRGNIGSFKELVPNSLSSPTSINPAMLELLLHPQPDRLSIANLLLAPDVDTSL